MGDGLMSTPPQTIHIYHIVHIDRLASIMQDGYLYSDSVISQRANNGSMIGISDIKQRRLTNALNSYTDLYVGECVPFYFCPRSVMLYLIHRKNSDLVYQGGQDEIVHLQADFHQVVTWASFQNPALHWAFTTSNAGSYYFDDYNTIANLNQIDWNAVNTTNWTQVKEGKQAEFLIEAHFPWHLVHKIGVVSSTMQAKVASILQRLRQSNNNLHCPTISVEPSWYY